MTITHFAIQALQAPNDLNHDAQMRVYRVLQYAVVCPLKKICNSDLGSLHSAPPPIVKVLLTYCVPALWHFTAVSALQPFDSWGHERIHFPTSRTTSVIPPLVHGFPQHSLTWRTIVPLLAEKYTIIAPNNRGGGDSSLSLSNNYTAPAGGEDLRAILDILNITKVNVFAHDKGVRLVTSLAMEYPELLERLVLADYLLPDYGYPTSVSSSSVYQDWQLAFFAVPDATHTSSRTGEDDACFSHCETWLLVISLQYFAAAFSDAEYFTNRIEGGGKLQIPVLALGGEASLSPSSNLIAVFTPVAADLTTDVVPKVGHWIGDENPTWTANRLLKFFENSTNMPSVDLSWLEHTSQCSATSTKPY
ncbi:hypothetical protein LTR08_008685 [Meristemomyces frigidus]|nr:hypothetical protein LTR08_008685 [Meristemomyces frigidus]